MITSLLVGAMFAALFVYFIFRPIPEPPGPWGYYARCLDCGAGGDPQAIGSKVLCPECGAIGRRVTAVGREVRPGQFEWKGTSPIPPAEAP